MSGIPTLTIYERKFAQSDKTDAILVVDGKKLHVNKALLSYHSDYFKTLFNSDFKEKSMEEIEIKDVKFDNFATLLSLIQEYPISPTKDNFEDLLQLADRFFLPAAKHQVELFIGFADLDKVKKLQLADKYKLDALLNHSLNLFQLRKDYKDMEAISKDFSVQTKALIFDDFFHVFGSQL